MLIPFEQVLLWLSLTVIGVYAIVIFLLGCAYGFKNSLNYIIKEVKNVSTGGNTKTS